MKLVWIAGGPIGLLAGLVRSAGHFVGRREILPPDDISLRLIHHPKRTAALLLKTILVSDAQFGGVDLALIVVDRAIVDLWLRVVRIFRVV